MKKIDTGDPTYDKGIKDLMKKRGKNRKDLMKINHAFKGKKFDFDKDRNRKPSFPEGDPEIGWKKAELQAYCDANEIEHENNWTKQELLDAIEAG